MKIVADNAELRRVAARVGASVDMGGQKFNTQGTRMNVVKPRAPEPPTPAPAVDPNKAIAESIDRMGTLFAGAIHGLKDAMSVVQPMPVQQPAVAPVYKRVDWQFEIEREEGSDLMTQVRAICGDRVLVFDVVRGERHLVTSIVLQE